MLLHPPFKHFAPGFCAPLRHTSFAAISVGLGRLQLRICVICDVVNSGIPSNLRTSEHQLRLRMEHITIWTVDFRWLVALVFRPTLPALKAWRALAEGETCISTETHAPIKKDMQQIGDQPANTRACMQQTCKHMHKLRKYVQRLEKYTQIKKTCET